MNGTAPDTTVGGEVWEAGDTWLDDWTAGTSVAEGPIGQAAHLDFTPMSGAIYTAEATILDNQPNWIAFGFFADDPAGGDWTATDFSVRHSNAPGYAWALTRNNAGTDQEGFLGGGTAGAQPWNGDVVDPTAPVAIRIVLDTTAANRNAEWFLNDVSQGAAAAFAAEGNPGIGGIGFSHDRNAEANAGGTISDFSLTEQIVASADADGDNEIDGADLLILQVNNPGLIPLWESQFGTMVEELVQAPTSVPEPGLTGLLIAATLGIVGRRRAHS